VPSLPHHSSAPAIHPPSLHDALPIFLTGSQAELGTLNIRNTAEITGFNAFPEPLAYGDPIITRGRLTLTPDFNNSTNLPLYLERSEEHTSELQSRENLVCRLLLEKKT